MLDHQSSSRRDRGRSSVHGLLGRLGHHGPGLPRLTLSVLFFIKSSKARGTYLGLESSTFLLIRPIIGRKRNKVLSESVFGLTAQDYTSNSNQ